MNTDWLNDDIQHINKEIYAAAEQKQGQLTKPPGSLGRLEDIAVQLSALQNTLTPKLDTVQIVIFAGDHGIAEEGVSAFPQAVTVEMIRNFSRGGAAISVLAHELNARLEVINTGTVTEHETLEGVIVQSVGHGTANFSKTAAMNNEQLVQALNIGRHAVIRAHKTNADLFIAGDMGIANTSSATAIACALLNEDASLLSGAGTGLDSKGIQHKADVINRSLALHKDNLTTAEAVLQHLGGFEIAAMCGAYIACAQQGIPALVDGFISSVAALAAVTIRPEIKDWLFFSHASAEQGHRKVMQAMYARPFIDFDMRLGEASGAATVVPLMRMACALHNQMATFEQAGVSNKD